MWLPGLGRTHLILILSQMPQLNNWVEIFWRTVKYNEAKNALCAIIWRGFQRIRVRRDGNGDIEATCHLTLWNQIFLEMRFLPPATISKVDSVTQFSPKQTELNLCQNVVQDCSSIASWTFAGCHVVDSNWSMLYKRWSFFWRRISTQNIIESYCNAEPETSRNAIVLQLLCSSNPTFFNL